MRGRKKHEKKSGLKYMFDSFYTSARIVNHPLWLFNDLIPHHCCKFGEKDNFSFFVRRKPVNVNAGLNVNLDIIFSCLKMFFTS